MNPMRSLTILAAGLLVLSCGRTPTASMTAAAATIDIQATSHAAEHGLAPDAVRRIAASDEATAAALALTVVQVKELHELRGLSNDILLTLPKVKLDRALWKCANPKPDRPDEAELWRLEGLKDENGEIPQNAVLTARQQLDALPSPDGGGIGQFSWTWLGPNNIGGRIRSIAFHPTTPSTMFVGSVSGGLWKSTTSGTNWSVVNDFMANLAITTIVFDPTNASVMYVGTGEGFSNGGAVRGAGIFKSTDGGVTFSQLSQTNNSNFNYVNRLAISSNGATILAATNAGIFQSTNAGGNWLQRTLTRALDVDIDALNPSHAVAGQDNGVAIVSNNGGTSWSASTGIAAGGARVEVAISKTVANVVYASVNQGSGQLYRSTDGGATFTLRNSGTNYLGSQGWYDNVVWVSPYDVTGAASADTVIVGGIDLWRSVDGGTTLTRMSNWSQAPNSAHADQHGIFETPTFNGLTDRTVFFCNDGGVYRASNVFTAGTPSFTSGWSAMLSGLGITQFYGAGASPASNNVIGGTQDNGTLRYTPATGLTWSTIFGGDGGVCAVDPTNGNYVYGEYVTLDLFRSSTGGGSTGYINGRTGNSWKAPPYVITDCQNGFASFIAPFTLDPSNPNRMIAGARSVWRSNDVKTPNTSTTGPQWAAIKPPTTGNSNSTAVSVAPSSSDIIWVGHGNGDVYYTTNGTAATPTWTQRNTTSPALPGRKVTHITIDPGNPNHVLVTFGGYSAQNVWVTNNAGATWTALPGIPSIPCYDVEIHPQITNWLYVGTELGVLTSENGGLTWSVPNDGPANTPVYELFWNNGSLYAVTYGRGIYRQAPILGFELEAYTSGNGTGDLTVQLHNIPAGMAEGFVLASLTTTTPIGGGALFGITLDAITLSLASTPASPTNPLHFVPPLVPGTPPASASVFPAGAVGLPAGTTVDLVGVVFTPGLVFLDQTAVVRLTF